MSVLKQGKTIIFNQTGKQYDKNRNIRTQLVTTTDNALEELSGQKIWPQNGYSKSQMTDYNIEKVNYTENSLFYLNKRFLTIEKVLPCTMEIIILMARS